MIESLWLGLGLWRGSEGSRSLRGGVDIRQQRDFLGDGPTKIVEGFPKVGWVVVGFVGVLRAVEIALISLRTGILGDRYYLRDSKQLLVSLAECLDTLFEVEVLCRKLGLTL